MSPPLGTGVVRMKLGFTGTQRGMTSYQKGQFVDLLEELDDSTPSGIKEFRHGDCIGADAEAHDLVRANLPNCIIIGHPPTNDSKRAFCEVDLWMPPYPYLERNRIIVRNVEVMVATPGEMEEVLRSGTWATVRYARRRHVPENIRILWPK